MVETNSSFQSSWTLAESLIFQISNHLNRGRNAWLTGQLERYYWEFECIIRVLYGMLDAHEKESAVELESKIVELLPITSDDKKKKLIPLLKQYDGLVMTCLHKHKLDVPQKVDRTRMMA